MLPTSTYPMWYDVIPLFVPLNPSLYPTYQTIAKGLDSSIFMNYTGFIPGNVYPIHKQLVVPPTHIPYFVGNQFPIMVQPVTSKNRQPVQQLVIT
jgi:hypothetical protein